MCVIGCITTFAAGEIENNNSAANANNISVNQTVYGNLSSSSDVDWYKFTTNTNGYFYVEFNHDFVSSSERYWKIYLYDESGVNRIDGTSSSNYTSVAGNANTSTWTMGIPAGTYYIRITYGYRYSGNNYNLKVNFTAANDWETENNGSKSSADVISVNQTVNGSLSTKDDVDWYTFRLSSSCEVAITFDHKMIDSSSSYWTFYIYDSTGVTEKLSLSRKGNTESATTDYVALSSGQYYVKVVSGSNYSGSNYVMTVQEKHDHRGEWIITENPTCTIDGSKYRICTYCGLKETETLEALGHSFDDGTVTKEAGIFNKGERVLTCTTCGEQSVEKIGSKLWILPIIIVGNIIVIVGVVNYVRIRKDN